MGGVFCVKVLATLNPSLRLHYQLFQHAAFLKCPYAYDFLHYGVGLTGSISFGLLFKERRDNLPDPNQD